MANFHDRLKRFIDSLGLKVAQFEQELGFSNGSISKALHERRALGSDRLETIFKKFPDLSANWLLTGKGSMIEQVSSIVNEPFMGYQSSGKRSTEQRLKELEDRLEKLEKKIHSYG